MENKPIVTCNGDQSLISKLHPLIKQGLPREVVEWRRSYGRPIRHIRTDANFVPYQQDLVPREDNWILLGRAFLHIFWTECDIDRYKSTVKDEISEWLACLKSRNVSDWLIVIVVNDESKVKTKILRTSVLDKVKNDFCSKQQDRCAVLQEPFKPDSKSSESWSKLLTLMRHHTIQSFNNSLNRFEEHMRLQREKRQESNWTFNHYFLLQEELAFMFEMLGLYEDALVQYDELDALFTQFVLNHAAGDTTDWLQRYTDNAPTRWDSIQLSKPIDFSKRDMIRSCKDSLLDFRNYLFLRQGTLLFLLHKPWEVAERALPFMHNCLQELHLLQLKLPKGGSACWVFLTCLEIVKTCEACTTGGKMVDTYSLHMAVLWDYARKKMHDLGDFCGLLPKSETENLSLVVDLIAGFTLSEDTDSLIKLREALSSKASFTKHYLELSELAMGTYKHIGRIRSAKLICKDLADFYIQMDNYKKAEAFLVDALKVYVQEGWTLLADEIRISMANCQKQTGSHERYIRTCGHLLGSPTLSVEKKKYYQKEMTELCHINTDSTIHIPTKPFLLVPQILPEMPNFLVTENSLVNITIYLVTPEPLLCETITVSLAFHGMDLSTIAQDSNSNQQKPTYRHKRNPSGNSFGSFGSLTSTGSIDILNTGPGVSISDVTGGSNKFPPFISLLGHYEYSPNKKAVLSSSLKSKTNLKRIDSGNKMIVIDKEIDKGDYSLFMETEENGVTLNPGENKIVLKSKLPECGMYTVTQLCFKVGGVDFLRNIPVEEVCFYVLNQQPQLTITQKEENMYAGIHEAVVIKVVGGTDGINHTSQLCLSYPNEDISVSCYQMKNRTIELSPLGCEETREIIVYVRSRLQLLNGTSSVQTHQLTVEWKPLNIASDKLLSFQQPKEIHHKLHTAGSRKFVQCVVQSIGDLTFDLTTPSLICECTDVELISLNKSDKKLKINSNQNASYMWELKTNVIGVDLILPCKFSIQYYHNSPSISQKYASQDGSNLTQDGVNGEAEHILKEENDSVTNELQECRYNFTLENYKTLYSIESSVKIAATELDINIGKDCTFAFNVTSLVSEPLVEIAFTVTWDKKQWICTGQTQGLVKLEDAKFKHQLNAIPQCLGYIGHPYVQLFRVKEGWCKAIESNTTQGVPLDIEDLKEQDILISLPVGRVYYASLANRVHVTAKNKHDKDYTTLIQVGERSQIDTSSNNNKARLQVVDSGPL